MKKILTASLVAISLTLPVIAHAQTGAAPAVVPVTSSPAAAASAPAPAVTAAAPVTTMADAPTTGTDKKIELKDGSWATVAADGTAKVSNDGGKTWTPAPDGTWVSKDGATTLNIKNGKQI